LQQMAGVGLFAAKIPVVNKTLGQIMADVADPLAVPNDAVSFVSSVVADDSNQKFLVNVSGLDLIKKGVGVGDAVFYQSASGEVQGTIDTVDSAGFTVEFTIPFNPDPVQFAEHLDLGTSVEGLKLTAGGGVKFSIDPAFRLRVGIRLGGDVPIAERFYLAADDTPEVTLGVSASLDNPNVTGTFGDFLQVKFQEDPATTNNQAIHLTGTLTVNLTDPGTGA